MEKGAIPKPGAIMGKGVLLAAVYLTAETARWWNMGSNGDLERQLGTYGTWWSFRYCRLSQKNTIRNH